MSFCVFVCVYLSVCVHDNSKNNGSIQLKPKHENSSDEFDIGHCPNKVKVTAQLFLHLPQYKLSSSTSQLWHKLRNSDLVCLLIR